MSLTSLHLDKFVALGSINVHNAKNKWLLTSDGSVGAQRCLLTAGGATEDEIGACWW